MKHYGKPIVDVFDYDIAGNFGYLYYTTNAKLSNRYGFLMVGLSVS